MSESRQKTYIPIAGCGAVSALGNNVAQTARNILFEPRKPQLPHRIASSLPNPVFELDLEFSADKIPGGRTNQLLLMALEEALHEAELSPNYLQGKKVGVCIGTTVGCQLNSIAFCRELYGDGVKDITPLQSYIDGSPASFIQRRLQLSGPTLTVSNACTSGADAIAIGKCWLESGLCDLVITGGADELNLVPMIGFNALGVCSNEHCRPFDDNRSGLNLGEGAGVVILESRASAQARSKINRFCLAGSGKSSDGFHITQPDMEGTNLERAIRRALESAQITPNEIALVNAHGTGTIANDLVESKVLGRVFTPKLLFQSTKSMTGHTLGAAGALEFIFCRIMLESKIAVQSHNFINPMENVNITPIRKNSPFDGCYALSTSLAFGGSNTALVIARSEE